MALKYKLEITIEAPDPAAVDAAYEEIVGSIEDARDSNALGGCEVSWNGLELLGPV